MDHGNSGQGAVGCFINAKMEEGHYCTLKMEAVSSSETLVHIYIANSVTCQNKVILILTNVRVPNACL